MIDSYRVHFSGIIAKNESDDSIFLIGNLLSTEVCVSNGILYSYMRLPFTIYPIYDVSFGTKRYGALKEFHDFWKYSNPPKTKNGSCFFYGYEMSDYRRYLLRDFL